MICLSQEDIERIGESVLRDYTKRMVRSSSSPIDIAHFARCYLDVNIQHRKLSVRGDILGLTTYSGINLELSFPGENIVLSVPEDTILLEETLFRPNNFRRWRFTLAHECAHQILMRMQKDETGRNVRGGFVPGKTYSYRDLRTTEDWSEWQANVLAAALLMPRAKLLELLDCGFKPLTRYGSRFNSLDYASIRRLANRFCVSIKAMEIRLNGLGYITRKPESEYTGMAFVTQTVIRHTVGLMV